MFLLFPKTFVQLFMRTSQVVPRALVLVVVVGEPLERGAGLGCKLVLAESGALHSAHPAPPASQASLPEQCMASVDAPLAPLECNVVVESLSGDHQWVCNTQHYCNRLARLL